MSAKIFRLHDRSTPLLPCGHRAPIGAATKGVHICPTCDAPALHYETTVRSFRKLNPDELRRLADLSDDDLALCVPSDLEFICRGHVDETPRQEGSGGSAMPALSACALSGFAGFAGYLIGFFNG